MVLYKIDKDFTTINDVQIVHGKIVNNPFAVSYTRTQAVQWILQNSDLVRNNLKKHLKRYKPKWYSISDCYSYALDYFMDKSKVFLDNFSEDSEYTIEKYIMGNLKHVVTEYTRIKDAGNILELSLSTNSDDLDSLSKGSFTVSEEIIHRNKDLETSLDETLIDYVYWDLKFEAIVDNFKVFLRGKNYLTFDEELFIYTLFFDVYFEQSKQLEYVAKQCTIPFELVKLIAEDLGIAYKEESVPVKKVYDGILNMQEVTNKYVLKRNRK